MGSRGITPHQRALVPVDEVDEVITCKPEQCRRCGKPLTGSDPEPWRQQVVELPPVHPHITEYQLHRLKCAGCGITTCGELPAGVAPTCYGPRLASVVALCTGGYRMSKRMVASFCREVLGIELSLGEICQIEQTVTKRSRRRWKKRRSTCRVVISILMRRRGRNAGSGARCGRW